MNSQSLGLWFLKGSWKFKIKICSNFHIFLFEWKLKAIFWHAIEINMEKDNQCIILKKENKGFRILFGQF